MGDLQSQTLLALAVSKLFQNMYGIAECKNIQQFMGQVFFMDVFKSVY
jgi:purine-nucleoside phosphorylase